MIPDQVAKLAIVLLALWVLYRWGAIILAALAVVHFVRGEWYLAVLACIYAGFITLVRAFVSWLDWCTSGRCAFVRGRFRSFPNTSHSD